MPAGCTGTAGLAMWNDGENATLVGLGQYVPFTGVRFIVQSTKSPLTNVFVDQFGEANVVVA